LCCRGRITRFDRRRTARPHATSAVAAFNWNPARHQLESVAALRWNTQMNAKNAGEAWTKPDLFFCGMLSHVECRSLQWRDFWAVLRTRCAHKLMQLDTRNLRALSISLQVAR
jgi:hypothetical protein